MLNITRDAEFWIARQADTMEMATTVSSASNRTTPMTSQVTPIPLITAMNRTPTALITVAIAINTEPSTMPLAAPDAEVTDGSVPMIWKPDHTALNCALSR